MKTENFLSAIGDIDDGFIEEAASFDSQKIEKDCHKNKRTWTHYLKYTSLAACLLIAVFTCIHFSAVSPQSIEAPVKEQNVLRLPDLNAGDYTDERRGQTKKVADSSALEDGNPWSDSMEVDELPVYENTAYKGQEKDEFGAEEDESEETKALQAKAIEVAEEVDMQVLEEATEDSPRLFGNEDSPSKTAVCRATVLTDQGEIIASSDCHIEICFSQGIQLPEDYQFTKEEMDKEKATMVTEYLLSQYGKLLSIENPKASVALEYDGNGDERWVLRGYDHEASLEGDIVNYNLKQMRFELDEEGNLQKIMLKNAQDCSKELGNYPIITQSEAKKLLLEGSYLTYNGQDMFLPENIEKVRMVYLTGVEYETFMPYYAFDVRIDDQQEDIDQSLKQYATYYVPAVSGKYIENMPMPKEVKQGEE